jgi:hypothetical protein
MVSTVMRVMRGMHFRVTIVNTLPVPRRWVGSAQNRDVCFTKEDGTEMTEKGALEGLSEKIGKHVAGSAMGDGDVMALDVISDEKITNVDVAGTLTAG